jgi:hypothetical protein
MKTVAKWCAVATCLLALSGCAAVAVGTATGTVFGARLGARLDRGSRGGAGTDVGAAVVVSFSVPRDIHAAVLRYDLSRRGVPTDSLHVRAVTSLSGRIANNVNDSLMVMLSEANGARGRLLFGGKHSTVILRDTTVRVRILNRNPARNTGVLFGALVGFVTSLSLALYFLFRSGRY